MHSVDSVGRKHEEPLHPYRGPFQRDRDRILHSWAYRRLSGKTQVFTGDMGDYHRTRLTHTQEVASIARTLARVLRLNEDLVEALALFHDIGHPPFGHAGEDALNEYLAGHGGFSHNQHALVIAEELEMRYHGFPGLNLSHEVLQGQRMRADKQSPARQPLLEVQIVDAADSMTYDAHDTDDAVKLGLLTVGELAQNELIHGCLKRVGDRCGALDGARLRKAVVHELIDCQVTDLLERTKSELADRDFSSAAEASQSDFVIGPSVALAEQKKQLESFLYDRVYRHDDIVRVRQEAQDRLQKMFAGYLRKPDLLSLRYRQRIELVGLDRAIGEYLAGMTDRFCDEQFRRHFTEYPGG